MEVPPSLGDALVCRFGWDPIGLITSASRSPFAAIRQFRALLEPWNLNR